VAKRLATNPLPFDEERCADALQRWCPERDNCRRWVDRYPAGDHTPWVPFTIDRTSAGCQHIIRIK